MKRMLAAHVPDGVADTAVPHDDAIYPGSRLDEYRCIRCTIAERRGLCLCLRDAESRHQQQQGDEGKQTF